MSREIKFRAWSPDNKEMYYADADYSFRVYNNSISYRPHYESDELEYYSTDPGDGEKKIWVMEYTGLKDKNGKEIYEGDILKHNQNIYIVWWTENMGICLIHKKHFTPDKKSVLTTDNRQDFNFMWNTQKYIEVIGNIYQNPELIETAAKV